MTQYQYLTSDDAKNYMMDRFVGKCNQCEVYDIVTDRRMKKAINSLPIDHFIFVNSVCLIGFSINFGSIYTILDVGPGNVVITSDQQAFIKLASDYNHMDIIKGEQK